MELKGFGKASEHKSSMSVRITKKIKAISHQENVLGKYFGNFKGKKTKLILMKDSSLVDVIAKENLF